MARTTLETQLDEIRTRIIRLGTLAETALEQAMQAVQSTDQALCEQVVAADDTIDAVRSEIERMVFQSLTLQQPLAGLDLRFLTSAPTMASGLERIGDNAAGIATLLVRMAPLRSAGARQVQLASLGRAARIQQRPAEREVTEASIVSGIVDLGQEARRVLQETMGAFARNDAPAARAIWQEDDVVDVRYHMIRHEAMTMLTDTHAIPALRQDRLIMQRMTYWLWIAHNLERVGDHCTNICERIVFILEGEGTIRPAEDLY